MTDQQSRILSSALEISSEANEGVRPSRRVSVGVVSDIVQRSLSLTTGLPFSVREHVALRDVSDFISLSQRGHSQRKYSLNTDLLPICHPLSTRNHALTAAALRESRARWVSDDPFIKSDEVRSLVASLHSSPIGSLEHEYYMARVLSAPQGTVPLRALVAALGGNSSAARSMRAKLQRRDSKGRFAWMGGGMSVNVRMPDGSIRRLTGRLVAQGGADTSGDTDTFDFETPDGKIYRVKASSGEGSKAYIESPDAPDGISPVEAEITAGDPVADLDSLETVDAPAGFYKVEDYDGPGEAKYTDEAFNVVKYDKDDPDGPNPTFKDVDFDKPVYSVTPWDDDTKNPYVFQTWDEVQDFIRGAEVTRDEKEGRTPPVLARLKDDQLDKVVEDVKEGEDPEDVAKRLFGDQFGQGEAPKAPAGSGEFPDAPEGAYVLDTSEKYIAEGRDPSVQESVDYTDDPVELANRDYTNDEIIQALKTAVMPKEDGSSAPEVGQLEFDAGSEDVPAEALYEALQNRGLDAKDILGQIYDGEDVKAPSKEEPASAKEIQTDFAPETIPYETVSYDEEQKKNVYSSGESEVIDFAGRKIVLLDVNGVKVPFYLSTGFGGKAGVETGRWYPFFGIFERDGWINKLGEDEINDYYGSSELRAASEWLDQNIGDVRDDESIPKVKPSGKHIDAINQDMNPAENEKSDTEAKVKKNIADVLDKISEGTPSKPKAKAELPEEEKKELPALLEGLSDDEKSQFDETGDYKPFLPKNEDMFPPEGTSYYEIRPEPFENTTDSPELDPLNLANNTSSDDLKDALRESLEPGNDGMGSVLKTDEDGEEVKTSVPAEALRDALQLQGESTDDFIKSIYDEGTIDEPSDDEAADIIEEIGAPEVAETPEEPVTPSEEPVAELPTPEEQEEAPSVETPETPGEAPEDVTEPSPETEPTAKKPKSDVGPIVKTAKSRAGKYYSVRPNGEKDRSMQYTDEYVEHLFSTPADELTLNELSDLVNVSDQVPAAVRPFVSGASKDAMNTLIKRANGESSEPEASSFTGDVFVAKKGKGKGKATIKTEEQTQQEKDDAPEIDSPEAVESSPEDMDSVLDNAGSSTVLPTPTPENPTGVYIATPDKLLPGDIAFKNDPEREYFVVQSVEKKGSKVLVTGYYPGHQPQVKQWKATTPITFIRGLADLPESGDKPPLERPFSKNYGDGKVQKDENGDWMPVDEAAKAQYIEDKKAFEEAKAASGASVDLPVNVDAYDPIPLSAPWKPSNPALSGEKIKQLAEESGGDPKKFAELLKKQTVYYIDFETTGGDWDNPTPIQVAVYKYTNGELDGEPFVKFMKPGKPLDDWYENQRAEDPSKMLKDSDGNPITNEWLDSQPDKAEVMKELYEFLGEDPIIVAHNMSFESLILNQQAEAIGVDFASGGEIDTYTLAKTMNPKMKNNLAAVAARYGIKDQDWHDASADAAVMPTILFGLLDDMKPWQAEKLLDIEARDSEFAEKIDKYNSDMEKYKTFAAERAAAEAYSKMAAGEPVSTESIVEAATVKTDAPSEEASSPSNEGLVGLDTPVGSVVGDQITEAWITDDENTEDLGNVTGLDFKVGDFYGSEYGWSEIVQIEQDPDKGNLLIVSLKKLTTGSVKFYRFKKNEAKYKIRRRYGLTGGKEVEATPSEDIVEPQTTEEVPTPDTVAAKSPFDDEFGIDIDMSDWVKDGGQAGSNEGAFYTDPKTGLRYYVKKPKSAKHARNEALASAFYNEAGVRHGRIYIGKDADGNEVLISPLVTGDITELGNTDWQNDPDILKSAQNGFVMDAWLNNWDSVGMNYDNMIVKGKDVYRIDPGGALIFRANGGDKSDTLTPEAQQIDDLRFKGKKASSVFGSMTDEEIKEDAKKLVGISPERIEELVDTAFSDDSATGNFIKEMLIARRKTIMDRFGLTEEDFPGNEETIEPTSSDVDTTPVQDEIESYVPDVAPGVDSETGGFSPDLQQLVDLFVANPAAANDFLNKVKEDNPDISPELVDSLISKVNKPEATEESEPKDIAEIVTDDIIAEAIDDQVTSLDSLDPEIEDAGLEGLEDISSDLDEILDDDTLGDADKIIKRIFEEYEANNNGDGTFTIKSITRNGADGNPEKLEIQIQKNKGNSFSVIFVQTKWDQDGNPVIKTVNKYAARESFKALNNNVKRAQKLLDGFEKNESLSTDKFMKLVSQKTYKTVAGQDAIEAIKATHISADGISEIAPGDRVYNWKNGKWGTVDSYYTEYTGQGIHKVKDLVDSGEDAYKYTDYVKVRWDNAPGKALPVVSNAMFKIDPDTGFAVDNPVPVLLNSKGKPKPKQPTKPESSDPNPSGIAVKKKKGSPAAPKVSTPTPAPTPTPTPTPTPEVSPEPVDVTPTSSPAPTATAPVSPDVEDIIDGLAARVGGRFNYKGEDVEIINVSPDGVSYKNIATGEEETTPLEVWDSEEIDGTVDVVKADFPSNPDSREIGDEYTYNASDGSTTLMTLNNSSPSTSVTYRYEDKNGKQKLKTIPEDVFKELIQKGKIVPGNAKKSTPTVLRDIREIENANKPRIFGNAPEPAPEAGTSVGEFSGDGSAPLPEFSSVEEAFELAKALKKSGYQHRVTYDGSSIADMEVVVGVAKVDGKENSTVRFRLQKSDAERLQQMIQNTPTMWETETGVLIPERKINKTGMIIDTNSDSNIPLSSGFTYKTTLADGTQIRFYRDYNGSTFSFGDIVEVYSPNTDFGKSNLDEVMSELDIPKESQKYPTAESIKTLAEKRFLKYFRTGKSDSGYYKDNPNDVGADLAAIQQQWGVTPDDIRLTQGPDGRLELTLPDEVAQKIVDAAGINHIYATTGAKNIHNVLGGANPGMQSTTQRVFGGTYSTGNTSAWSQTSDMGTGGADFVFVRPNGTGSLANNGSTKIVIDPLEIVKRLDVFTYDHDSFGAKNPSNYDYKSWLGTYGTSNAGQPEMLKKANANYTGSPEIMIRHNVPLSAVLGYVFNNESNMNDALARLKEVGITEVNGIPVGEFLKSGSVELKKLVKKAKAGK